MKSKLNEELIVKSGNVDFFPDVINMLVEANVTRYAADLTTSQNTYYNDESGAFFTKHAKKVEEKIADTFDVEKLKSAIKWAQAGESEYSYAKFLSLIKKAGIALYIVFINGKMVCYMGKNGDVHKEYFPSE